MGSKRPPRQSSGSATWKKAPTQRANPRLTHFIALPIGHHVGLRDLMGRFTRSLLNDTNPPIWGLDESVLVPPRRLHFTLGVMSLASTPSSGGSGTASLANHPRTVDDAIQFLENLKPRLDDLLRVSVSSAAAQPQKMRVTLDSMDVMKLEKEGGAHVLWVGPKDGNSRNITNGETDQLRRVCDFIHTSFKEAGFLVEEGRPLKLHCTIINTVYRKPKPRDGKRIPFSYADFLASPWFARPESLTPQHHAVPQRSTQRGSTIAHHPPRGPISVNFGTWDINEVQICEMGSHGPEGEYVCVGKVSL